MNNDPKFRSQFNLFTMNKTRLINVVEHLPVNDDLFFEDIYSIKNDDNSNIIVQVITISYLDLISNKQIIAILQSNNATDFGQHLFFFKNCT